MIKLVSPFRYPAATGDVAHPNSYGYRTPQCTVLGLTFGAAQTGTALTSKQRAALATAVNELTNDEAVLGITGDFGFLIMYQLDFAGCEDLPGFDAVAQGEAVDVECKTPHVVEFVQQQRARSDISVRSVLIECTELPPYANAIRKATKLPLLDVIKLCGARR